LLNEIIINYPHLYRDKKTYSSSDYYSYCYDVECNNKNELKNEILKLVIDLIYYDVPVKEKNNLYYMTHYLISRRFKCNFKLISKSSLLLNITSISELYYYFISNGKIKKPIFNEDIIIEPIEQTLKNCCCCLEDYTDNFNITGCCNSVQICEPCFIQLSPRRCPFCRSYNLRINDINNRKIKFKYNNKLFEEEIKNNLDDNEILLYYLGYNEKGQEKIKIKNYSFSFNNMQYFKENFFDSLEDSILYYDINILNNYSNIPLDLDILKHLKIGCEEESEGRPILKYLQLIEGHNLISDDEIETNRDYFFNEMVHNQGLENVIRFEFIEKIAIINDTEIYITSDDGYIGDYGIRKDYFIKEFEQVLETNEENHNIFNLSI
jgi:hypothetical protein